MDDIENLGDCRYEVVRIYSIVAPELRDRLLGSLGHLSDESLVDVLWLSAGGMWDLVNESQVAVGMSAALEAQRTPAVGVHVDVEVYCPDVEVLQALEMGTLATGGARLWPWLIGVDELLLAAGTEQPEARVDVWVHGCVLLCWLYQRLMARCSASRRRGATMVR